MRIQLRLRALVFGLLVVFFNFGNVYADSSDVLKKLLIDVSGWEAGDKDGASMDMGGIKMITATRTYEDGDKTFTASILVGSNAMMQAQNQSTSYDSSDGTMHTEMIDGFYVARGYDKSDQSGYVVVNIHKGMMDGAMLTISYDSLTPEEALKISQEFDWSEIKSETQQFIQQ